MMRRGLLAERPANLVIDSAAAQRAAERRWIRFGLGPLIGVALGFAALLAGYPDRYLPILALGGFLGSVVVLLGGDAGAPASCKAWGRTNIRSILLGQASNQARPTRGLVILSSGEVPLYRVPLSSINAVETRYGRVVFTLTDGRIELDDGCRDGLRLAREVAAEIGRPLSEPAAATLDAREVARLIGGSTGSGLEVPLHGPFPKWFPLVPLAMFGAMRLVLQALSPAIAQALDARLLVLAATCGAICWLMEKRSPSAWLSLRVEPAGVVHSRRGGRTMYPWPDIHSLEPEGHGWRLRTYLGDLVFPRRGAEPVVAAIQKVLAAREAGQVLPRLGFVGDAAISPVREGEERAERGISRSEGDGE